METALLILLVGVTIGIYLKIRDRKKFDRVAAGQGDWLMVRHEQPDGSFFSHTFYPIIAWRLEEGIYWPEMQNATQLKLHEEYNPKGDKIFLVRDGLVFNYHHNCHPVGLLSEYMERVTDSKPPSSSATVPLSLRPCFESKS